MSIGHAIPNPYGARNNTAHVAKYSHVLYVKLSNKV